MIASRLLPFGVCCFLLSSVALADKGPGPASSGGDSRLHKSTAVSDPDPRATSVEKRFRIDRSTLGSVEWQDAIRRALSHQSGRGRYTLLRVLLDDAGKGEKIQAQGLKIKELTDRYHGGGGLYQTISSGGFLFLEQLESSERKHGRDPIIVGTALHGSTKLWIDEPPNGMLGIIGDVILSRCPSEETGTLLVKFKAPPNVHETKLTIGPVVVGGPYGDTHSIDVSQEFRLQLPAGNYKILLPDFDPRIARWDVTILSKTISRLTFRLGWTLEEADVDFTPTGIKNESTLTFNERPLAEQDSSAKLRLFQIRRLAMLNQLYKLAVERQKAGRASFNTVHDAEVAYLHARLDLCDTKEDRLGVLQTLVHEAESWQKTVAAAVKNASLDSAELLRAKLYLLETHIALERATPAR